MEILFKIIFGAISSLSGIAAIHFVYFAISKPDRFIEFYDSLDKKMSTAYQIITSIGWCLIMYGGLKHILYWMPDSEWFVTEDGDPVTLKEYIAGTVSFLSLQILINLEQSARKQARQLNQSE